ncbi:MAG: methyltransferase, partial [Oscillospiraceae bacterium]|nr:methyltransferase [Oscillospiraceae bacterium]
FAAQKWPWLDGNIWKYAKAEAESKEFSGKYDIRGGDIDPKSIAIASENAKRAGVSKHIRFETADALKRIRETDIDVIVTNPPYGERMLEKERARELCRAIGEACRDKSDSDIYILSCEPDFERLFGAGATKRRKLYNGMIKCALYMYLRRFEKGAGAP